MYIDGLSNIPSANQTNVAELIGRLHTGDVIRARVLESRPDKAVLKLSDGTVLKASLNEGLEVKAGQTITLTVASIAEGKLFLEIIREPSDQNNNKSDVLKKILDSLQLKPNSKNLTLAAEFLKSGTSVTKENFKAALDLMKNFKGIDSEKAVFIASKALSSGKVKMDLLLKFLDGNIKIGNQLEELQSLMDQIDKRSGGAAFIEEIIKNTVNSGVSDNSVNSGISDDFVNSGKPGNSPYLINSDNTSPISDTNDSIELILPDRNSNGENPHDKAPAGINPQKQLQQALQNLMEAQDEYINWSRSKPENELGKPINKDFNMDDPNIKNIIKELFIKIDSDKLPVKSGKELDFNNLQKEIDTRLEILKSAVQKADQANLPEKEILTASFDKLQDMAILINRLNQSMHYYQLPVCLTGYNTTAEIFVMKRNQKKKSIDPRNTIMFVSLDTKNIGRVETLLELKGKNISVNFRMENKIIEKFLKENIKYLYKGLTDCGLKLVDVKYAIMDKAALPITLEKILTKAADAKYEKFDFRI